ncbi:SMP-30/gluconolactonase/LRE family protein [Thalassotalea sp. PLHSN55]|uniref:SMP-30/gluconolactonase/LRE family protein n=1 Tax=Thalassotalea sp. PLHSN55 TaxID=3435888 RepID=UPI003F84DE64
MKNLTLLCDSQCELGEGPIWHAIEQRIYWVDIIGKRLHSVKLDGSDHQTWQFDSEISSINCRAQGGFIVTLREGFALLELSSGLLTPIASPESDIINNRYNDAKIDVFGELWAGTMDDNEQLKSGALYKLDAQLQWQIIDTGYCITNGPAFTKNNAVLYHTDTLKRVIYKIFLDQHRQITSKQVFINIPEQDGYPDGMNVDSEGNLWVCHFAGGKVVKYSEAGQRLTEYQFPVSNITSCTFVGENLNRMVFTTAKKCLSDEQLAKEPQAGGLFIATADASGIAVPPFAG